MGAPKKAEFLKHKKLSDYSIEKGLIDYVDARAKDFQTTGSEMFSRIVRFYMEYNDTGTILEEKRKKADVAQKDYDTTKAVFEEKMRTAHLHAESLAIKYVTGSFEGVKKRDYVYFEMAVKTGLSPETCLDILDDVTKRQADRAVETARRAASAVETSLGRA